MLTALQRSGGIEALARQAGVEPAQALAMTKDILPGLLGALRGIAGGRQALLALFEQRGGAGLAAMVMGMDQADPAAGQAIIAWAQGDDSGGLSELAARSGAGGARLLPLLAMLVGGYVCAMSAGHGQGPPELDALLGGAR